MKKDAVIIKTPTNITDAEAVITQTWTTAVSFPAIVLPMGQELALKYCGYDAPVKYRIFYKGRNADIKAALAVGNMAVVRGEELYIVFTADYGKVVDVLINMEMPVSGGVTNG